MTQFFMAMIPPTVTHQQHRVKMVHGKPTFYDSPELKDARMKLTSYLSQHRPEKPYTSAVRLTAKWLFPVTGKHHDGEYRATKPDTDNLQKLLKDCMTACGYWTDDALVASEICEKFWAEHSGIFVKVESL
jgi:Holliday junction resolvase RusA-like endonuclease